MYSNGKIFNSILIHFSIGITESKEKEINEQTERKEKKKTCT